MLERCSFVNARSEAIDGARPVEETQTASEQREFEAVFRAQYERIARVLARVVREPARAEELAVEVFLKLWRNRQVLRDKPEGWLYRTAVRKGLDELRRRTRQERFERLLRFALRVPTPEEIRARS